MSAFFAGFATGLSDELRRQDEIKLAKQQRQEELNLRRQEREEERAFQRQMFEAQILENRRAPLFKALAERNLYEEESSNVAHNLSVLKSLGASDETVAEASNLSGEALAESVEYIRKQQEKYAGTPMVVGPTEISTLIGSAVTTQLSGKKPNIKVAAEMYGIAEEDLDKPAVGGMTYRDVIISALSQPPGKVTTFTSPGQGKPLESSDIKTIQDAAGNSLTDALQASLLEASEEASRLRAKQSSGEKLTDEEVARQKDLNFHMRSIKEAQEALKKGAPGSAINLVGGRAILPYITNNPNALNYSFGSGWDEAINKYVLPDEEALSSAAASGRFVAGDRVIVRSLGNITIPVYPDTESAEAAGERGAFRKGDIIMIGGKLGRA